MELTVQAIVNAIMGAIVPFIIEKIPPLKAAGSRTLILITGVLGTIIAFGVNYLMVQFGLVTTSSTQELVLIGFAINQTAGELSYRTWIKK